MLYGEDPPVRGTCFRLQAYERAGILVVEAYKSRQGNLSSGSVKGPKGLTDDFYGFIKSRKRFSFVIDSYLKDNAFTAVKRDAKFRNKVCERGTGKKWHIKG